MTASFTPESATFGGVLIGMAATLLWATCGRTAGVSGIVSGVLRPQQGELGWQAAFLTGLVLAGAVGAALSPGSFGVSPLPLAALAFSGLLVGLGTRLGGGCTSGHGVCGLSRGAPRSVVATLTFMVTAVAAVAAMRHLTGAQ